MIQKQAEVLLDVKFFYYEEKKKMKNNSDRKCAINKRARYWMNFVLDIESMS